MKIKRTSLVGQVVSENFKTAEIFKSHQIDFCCQGNRTVEEACEKKGVAFELIQEEISVISENKNSVESNFSSMPLDQLCDTIEETHHTYVEKAIQDILPYLNKVCKVHGSNHPELLEVLNQFNKAANELTQHMKKEELILFPYIRKIAKQKDDSNTVTSPIFGSVTNPINTLREEHETEGNRFMVINKLTNQFTPPEDACNTYKVTYNLLKEFEEDLHTHIHLENNILFPRAIELEKI